MLRGGDSGPALIKSDADASLLIERIVKGEMPPEKEPKLSADKADALRDWIRAGAPAAHPEVVPAAIALVSNEDRQFWAFRPLSRPDPPFVADRSRIRTMVDPFVLEKLQPHRLSIAPDADTVTLLRRAWFDLLGLPPTIEEVDAFLADSRPDAYERLLDKLLASPHFGERWGRHWLDVAGYTDTVGFDQDTSSLLIAEGKWRYRDYVIAAFNDDLPYDRFITEQLAGDELVDWRNAPKFTPEILRLLSATGYLRTARDQTTEDVGEIPLNYFGVLHDTVSIVANGLLGLTVNCAQCHNHKFDPIPQHDYYQLMALFTPAYNPLAWRPVLPYPTSKPDRSLPDVSPAEQAEIERYNVEVDRELQELKQKLSDVRQPHETRLFDAKLATLPEPLRADTKTAIQTAADKRTEVQKYLAAKLGGSVAVKPEELAAALSEPEKSLVAQFEAQAAKTESRRRKWGKIQALFDLGPPPPTHFLTRGDHDNPGEEVVPGYLSVLCDSAHSNRMTEKLPPESLPIVSLAKGATSGRRLAFARWLTEPGSRSSALVARVMVNRIWQHLFQQGLVPTPENFGRGGEPPTHPELLEWLANEFVRTGWHVKPMIKLLMTSTAYRQSSQTAPRAPDSLSGDPEIVDPGNRWLWRMRLRRLEAEAIRDSLLAVSGGLDTTMGGPSIIVRARPDGLVEIDEKMLPNPGALGRRSVYLLCRRSYNLSLLTVFDQPLVSQNCAARDVSAVPLQSLAMLNNAFVTDQARAFASRVERLAGCLGEAAVPAAFRLALVRSPTAAEMQICAKLLERQAAEYRAAGRLAEEADRQALLHLCHTLLNTSEFLYLE